MNTQNPYRKAAKKAKKLGGFVHWLPKHAVMFYPRGARLVVTFDATKAPDEEAPIFAWGHALARDNTCSHLAVIMTGQDDWYRCNELRETLHDLKEQGFFAGFDEVVFSGCGMGGFAALAFAPLGPGGRVVALMPQTSIDPRVAPFETRHRAAFVRDDWTGPYSDGAVGARSAKQVFVLADPYFKIDAAHVARLPQSNLTWLKTPHLKQQAARMLGNLGVLDDVLAQAWSGTLTAKQFSAIMEQHKGAKPMARLLIRSAIDAGHYSLAEKALDAISEVQPKWEFTPLVEKLQEAQRQN